MLNDYQIQGKVYLCCGYTDLRKGMEGLSRMVEEEFGMRLEKDSLFLFCGRRSDRIKGILWEGDGYLLLYKRLEEGKFRWPRKAEELVEMSEEQYRYLMRGMEVIVPEIPVRKVAPKTA